MLRNVSDQRPGVTLDMTCQGLTHGLYSIALEKFTDGDEIPHSLVNVKVLKGRCS